tara:strand:- start:37 stop:387 length:351 start_codon:yes stop_codon:yes gene_type:complete
MELVLDHPIDIEKLKQDLANRFPEYKIKSVLLNKKSVRVINGMNQVVVGQRKNGKVICVGNLNMLDWRIFIPFIILLGLMLITGFLFILIMGLVKKKQFKAFEAEIATYLQEYFSK